MHFKVAGEVALELDSFQNLTSERGIGKVILINNAGIAIRENNAENVKTVLHVNYGAKLRVSIAGNF